MGEAKRRREAELLSAQPGPVQERYRAQLNAIAEVLDEVFNEGKTGDARDVGFFLAIYAFGEPSPGERFNYISNTDALDVRATLADILARLEGRLSQSGTA